MISFKLFCDIIKKGKYSKIAPRIFQFSTVISRHISSTLKTVRMAISPCPAAAHPKHCVGNVVPVDKTPCLDRRRTILLVHHKVTSIFDTSLKSINTIFSSNPFQRVGRLCPFQEAFSFNPVSFSCTHST